VARIFFPQPYDLRAAAKAQEKLVAMRWNCKVSSSEPWFFQKSCARQNNFGDLLRAARFSHERFSDRALTEETLNLADRFWAG
jgi:hypothetical protein